ncbi:hypothetical protein N0V82_008883 [Gnomoniopsis sp. IMI 355080]|nr:hypothetical protein N0V82_008883 [Gnomoniopsis sp. IMI 355080]
MTYMKSCLLAFSLLVIVASAVASPAFFSTLKRQVGGPGVGPVCKLTTEPSQQDVANALNQWYVVFAAAGGGKSGIALNPMSVLISASEFFTAHMIDIELIHNFTYRLTDVVNVNTFLNGAHDNLSNATLLEGLALGALNNAMDEPTQLGVLACIPGLSDDAENAITSADAGFGDNVLIPLNDITTNGSDTMQVMTDVSTINHFRCCTLLPDLDTLWLSAAEDEGLVGQVTVTPPRPNACSSLAC